MYAEVPNLYSYRTLSAATTYPNFTVNPAYTVCESDIGVVHQEWKSNVVAVIRSFKLWSSPRLADT